MKRFFCSDQGERECKKLSGACTLSKNEAPDFILKSDAGIWGIEITEATSAASVRLSRENECYDGPYDPSNAARDGINGDLANMSRDDFASVVEASRDMKGQTTPFLGDEPERLAAGEIVKAVKSKLSKNYDRSSLQKFSLFVYLNVWLPSPEPKIIAEIVSECLAHKLRQSGLKTYVVFSDELIEL